MSDMLSLALLFSVPSLMASSIIIVKQNRWWAWACWLSIVLVSLTSLRRAQTSTYDVDQVFTHQFGGTLLWVSLTALAIWIFKPLWMKIASESLWLRLLASVPVFLAAIITPPFIPAI
jgi:hypothetical protein